MAVHQYQAGILPGGADKVLPPEWLFFAPLCDSLGASGIDPTPTFARASVATHKIGSLELEAVASGVPRFAPAGYFAEGQRTNVLTYTEQLNNGSTVSGPWWRYESTVAADNIASPYVGAPVIADTVLEHSSDDWHGIWHDYTGGANEKDGISVLAKGAGRDWCLIGIWDSGGAGNYCERYINLSTGAVGSGAASGMSQVGNVEVEPYIDGWWRIKMLVQTVAPTNRAFYCSPALSDGVGNYPGSAETAGTHFIGPQIEKNVDFVSSYIPALAGAGVTRLQDKLSYPAANAPSGDGTIEAEITKYYQGTGGQGSALETVSATYTQGGRIMMPDNGRIRIQVYKGSIEGSVESVGLVYTPYVTYHAMGPFETDKVTLFVNGTRYGTDLSADMPVAQNRISIGMDGNDVNPFYGWIRNVRLWESFRVPA